MIIFTAHFESLVNKSVVIKVGLTSTVFLPRQLELPAAVQISKTHAECASTRVSRRDVRPASGGAGWGGVMSASRPCSQVARIMMAQTGMGSTGMVSLSALVCMGVKWP